MRNGVRKRKHLRETQYVGDQQDNENQHQCADNPAITPGRQVVDLAVQGGHFLIAERRNTGLRIRFADSQLLELSLDVGSFEHGMDMRPPALLGGGCFAGADHCGARRLGKADEGECGNQEQDE